MTDLQLRIEALQLRIELARRIRLRQLDRRLAALDQLDLQVARVLENHPASPPAFSVAA
jgi:hypothetical protein